MDLSGICWRGSFTLSRGLMVPKSKQTESVATEYLRQARIVWRELISIAKKLPKSRALTETQYICRAGYDLMQATAEADGIYAMTQVESAQRLSCLNDAYGRLCLIAMFIDAWLDDMPQVVYTEIDRNGAEIQVKKPFVKMERLISLAGSVSNAMKVTKGAIKSERHRLKQFASTGETDDGEFS